MTLRYAAKDFRNRIDRIRPNKTRIRPLGLRVSALSAIDPPGGAVRAEFDPGFRNAILIALRRQIIIIRTRLNYEAIRKWI